MANPYRQMPVKLLNKEIDFNTDTITATLHTATYTPNYDTHAYVSDLTNELSGSGYSTGGVTVASCNMTATAANSWGTSWAASTAYAVGAVIRPATGNGFIYRCTVAGTSGGSTPTFGTVVGGSTTDNTVTWECAGSGIVQMTAGNPTWSSPFSAGPFRYCAISDRTPGTAATQPLICLIDFGSNQTGGGGAFTVTLNANGLLVIFVP
jgi:hypothetical protein